MSVLFDEVNGVAIEACSVCVPSRDVSVEQYSNVFGEENIKKFKALTGVETLRRCSENETASDLGVQAASRLIQELGVNSKEIGVLVYLTQKPDNRFPATSYSISSRLGLQSDVLCLDVSLACSGFVYALHLASKLLLSDDVRSKALVVVADTSHKTLSEEDRTVIMLFGDSGSATLLSKSDGKTNAKFAFRTDGRRASSIITPAGAFKNRAVQNKIIEWGDEIKRSYYHTHMKGMAVFNFSITDVPRLINDFIDHAEINRDDIQHFALHQANLYMLKQIGRKIKVHFDKVLISIQKYGNNSSNSIPLLWCDHLNVDKDQNKGLTLISGFGAGLSWACGLVDISATHILPISEL